MAREKSLNDLIDEAVKETQAKVQILKTQEKNLILNNKELENKRNKLSQGILEAEIKLKKLNEDFVISTEQLDKTIAVKLEQVNKKDIEASSKLSEMNAKIKTAENLIKSNEGLKKNLEAQVYENNDKLDSLKRIVSLIQEILRVS